MRTSYRKWKEYPYDGEKPPPKGSSEAGYWPMFFSKGRDSNFLDSFHQPINWRIKNPDDINWKTELLLVDQTLKSLTPQ